jgi:uncharacterized protein YwqG
VDLAELPGADRDDALPRSGVLCFFYDAGQSAWGYDPKDKGSWAVVYGEDVDGRVSVGEYPPDLPEEALYTTVPVDLVAGASIPDLHGLLSRFSLSEEEEYRLNDVYGQFIERVGPRHQLLGHAAPIQGDMQLECQLASHGLYCGDSTGYNDPRAKTLEADVSCWQLLLQIDSEDRAGMMWGDAGRLYFWITEEDLKEKRFERAWMILQCY